MRPSPIDLLFHMPTGTIGRRARFTKCLACATTAGNGIRNAGCESRAIGADVIHQSAGIDALSAA